MRTTKVPNYPTLNASHLASLPEPPRRRPYPDPDAIAAGELAGWRLIMGSLLDNQPFLLPIALALTYLHPVVPGTMLPLSFLPIFLLSLSGRVLVAYGALTVSAP
jgi:hypothetical protein